MYVYAKFIHAKYALASFTRNVSKFVKAKKKISADRTDDDSRLQTLHSRPLRNSFCKALVRMSSHLVEDTNTKKKASGVNSEALRLAKESIGNKTVQVN